MYWSIICFVRDLLADKIFVTCSVVASLPTDLVCAVVIVFRGVRNPMKISDIGFLKTEPNRPQNSKTENSVSVVWFSKTDFGSLGTVFHVVSFTIHLAA